MLKKYLKILLWGLIFYIVLILIWYAFYYLGTQIFNWWRPYAFPEPIGVAKKFLSMCQDGKLFPAILASLTRCLTGYFISVIIGILFGLLITKWKFAERYLKPLLMGIQSLPSVCWVPFAILWFGLKNDGIIFVVVMGSVFGIALSVESSIRNCNPIYEKAARTMGYKGFYLFFQITIPASIPEFVSGLRQGWSFAWRALMSGEVMTATTGLGYSLMMGRNLADINQVMLIMLVIVLVGILIDRLIFSTLEKIVRYY